MSAFDLNRPAALPRVATLADKRDALVTFGPFGTPHRTPNQTGQGDHRFSASFAVEPVYGSEWKGAVHVYQRRPDGAEYQALETAIYRNGRMLPESNLPGVRAAAMQAYQEAFPWCKADTLKAWAKARGETVFCLGNGLWARAIEGGGLSYRGDAGDSSLRCLVEDISEPAAAPQPAPGVSVQDLPYHKLATLPAWEAVRPETDGPHKGLPLPAKSDINYRWGGPFNVPEVGARVDVRNNGRKLPGTVTGYFGEGGFLGLVLAMDGGSEGHAFGTEFEPIPANPCRYPDCDCGIQGCGKPAPAAVPSPVAAARYVDVTPTWSALLPALLLAYENGTPTGRTIAREELTRLASIVDSQIAEDEAAAKTARERFESDLAAAPAPDAFPDVAALLGPRERGNPADVFHMTETEARAMVWAWGRLVPGLVATPATAELDGEHAPGMGYGLTVKGAPGTWLWCTRAAVAHAVALAKAAPVFAVSGDTGKGGRPGMLPDCMAQGHVLGVDGTCRNCGIDLRGA